MKSFTSIIVLVLLILLISNCDSNNYPTEFDSISQDAALKQNLVGCWKFAGYYIYFYENGTYIDSSFINPIPREPGVTVKVCRENKKDELFLDRATKGLYTVEDGLLKRQPLFQLFDCQPLEAPAAYLYFDQRLQIKDDTLKLTPVFTYSLIEGKQDDIWGQWYHNYWAWSYHKSLPMSGASQIITETIAFTPDSTNYRQKLEGLPYEGINFDRSFNYNPPLLERTDDYTFFEVSFQKNRMNWYQKNRTLTFIRAN